MADRRLQVFHAVAKHLSFTKAAETLFMTQPAVTFQVKQLEEHLNTRLFDRAQGRIVLTPAGQVALEYVERILGLSEELDRRLKEMSGQAAGPLAIGASMTMASTCSRSSSASSRHASRRWCRRSSSATRRRSRTALPSACSTSGSSRATRIGPRCTARCA